MLIELRDFKGAWPSGNPENLPQGIGLYASGFRYDEGGLSTLKTKTKVLDLPKLGANTTRIYRIQEHPPADNNAQDPDAGIWLHWVAPDDVWVSELPHFGSLKNPVVFGGLAENEALAPMYTDYALATADPPAGGDFQRYPNNWRRWGQLPSGGVAPTVAVGGTPAAGEKAQRRYVVVTFVNELGQEGPPSLPSLPFDATPSQTLGLSDMTGISVSAVVDLMGPFTKRRVYVSDSGDDNTLWYLVKEQAEANLSYCSDVPAAPPANAIGVGKLVTANFGSIAGSGPHRGAGYWPNIGAMWALTGTELRFSEPGYNYAFPADYTFSDFPSAPVAAGVFGSSLVVATNSYPVLFQGTHPASLARTRLEKNIGCVSRKSLVQGPGFVGWATNEGFVVMSAAGVNNVSQPWVSIPLWQSLNPRTMHAVWWREQIVVFCKIATNNYYTIAFKLNGDPPVHYPYGGESSFVDPHYGYLYYTNGYGLYRADKDNSAPEQCNFISQDYVAARPTNINVAQVWGSDDLSLILHLYADGVLKHTTTITGPANKPFRLPGGYTARKYRVQFTLLAGKLTRIQLATKYSLLAQVP